METSKCTRQHQIVGELVCRICSTRNSTMKTGPPGKPVGHANGICRETAEKRGKGLAKMDNKSVAQGNGMEK